MNRETYLKERQVGQLSELICYDYFLSNSESDMDYRTFVNCFRQFLNMSFGIDVNKIKTFMDSKYNINVLINKEGKELKIY